MFLPCYNRGICKPAKKFSLLDVPNILRYKLYDIPNCQTGIGVAGIGDAIASANDLSTGSPDIQGDPSKRPLLQTGGAQFDDAGFQFLMIQDALASTISSFTGYFWGTYNLGAFWVALGCSSTAAGIFIDNSGLASIYADTGDQVVQYGNLSSSGNVLLRCSYDATTGSANIAVTGLGNHSDSATSGENLTFNTVAQALGLDASVINGNVDNRYKGQFITSDVITYGNSLDNKILNEINRLTPGYTL